LSDSTIKTVNFEELTDAQKRQCELQISEDLIARSTLGTFIVFILWFSIAWLIISRSSDMETTRWLLNYSVIFILSVGLRLYLVYVASKNITNTSICRRYLTLGLSIGCLTWGVMAACSYLETPLFAHKDLILFATVGLAAGGAVSFSASRFYTYIYVLCMLLPILLVEFFIAEEIIVEKVVIVTVYIFGLLWVTINSSREYMSARVSNLQLIEMTNTDGLTGVKNRRYFDLQLVEELQRAQRTESDITLLMIDVDRFKHINDDSGHLIGDECLVAIADCLKRSVQRISDTVARYGGDEFTIILANTDEAAGIDIAESIRLAVGEVHIMSNEKRVPLAISIGISYCSGSHEQCDAVTLLATADAALYQAKASGRNRITSISAC